MQSIIQLFHKLPSFKALLCLLLTVLSTASHGATSSSSMVYGKLSDHIYTANFDGGSVTWANIKNPAEKKERAIGKDIRRIALNEDETQLLASDYLSGDLIWLDALTLKEQHRLTVNGRPFGIIFDAKNNMYWATLFESSEILALSQDGEILHQFKSLETPRGLALTDDGRLLVSHAMTGQISIWNTNTPTPQQINTITLQTQQHKDEFVSQGEPRLLDDIAISPDGTQAWLPHVLWNFDHPFQFQSTIFPAVSILSLTPGEEREEVELRKQLFKQINIIDNNNRSRIVSNPHDAEFSKDGKKVYITLAASEDLMVFDRSRASSSKKKRSKRRKGKISQGGAKVTQILRHIPGDNPKGLLISGDHLFVQNAMSQDVVSLHSGGNSSFARVKIDNPSYYKTVEQDPLNKSLRIGTTLFNSGNTHESQEFPMTGDFWMSCNSCHLDGFNFTNRYLVENRGENKYQNAVLGHGRLNKMVAGDVLKDYLRIIQDTQGGMGSDTRDGAKNFNAQDADENALIKMSHLHQYVTAPQNMPLLASWLKLEDGSRRTVHSDEWINSASCANCHSEMFEQWSDSNHRLMGQSNPYFSVLEDIAAATEGEEFRSWCSGCHNPERVLTGLPFNGHTNNMFERGGTSLKQDLKEDKHGPSEGTGCLFCHRITKIEDAGGNAAMTVDLSNRERYVFENSSNDILNYIGDSQINARPDTHKKSYMQPFYKDELYCKSCHNEFSPGLGAMIVDTWGEWEQSSYNNPDNPAEHLGCIDCHMHADNTQIGQDIPGTSTTGGALKKDVKTHQFSGANHFLVGLRNKKQESMSIDLLKTSASLESRVEKNNLIVRVNNIGAGHALPTGVADFRQLWLKVNITDALGNVIFQSGIQDEAGNVEPNARMFMKEFGDKEGKSVGLIFWRYEKLLKDTRIPANGFRDEFFTLPENTHYPIKVASQLMYRVYPLWVTQAVQKKFPELPNPPTLELNTIVSIFDSPNP